MEHLLQRSKHSLFHNILYFKGVKRHYDGVKGYLSAYFNGTLKMNIFHATQIIKYLSFN